MRRIGMAIASLTLFGIGAAWPGAVTPLAAGQPGESEEPKTLKERLSDKASDEQRVDNCTVPLERRGATPRPDCGPSDTKLTLAPQR
jgi:hypothetical protein